MITKIQGHSTDTGGTVEQDVRMEEPDLLEGRNMDL